jgi:hypothetical protein
MKRILLLAIIILLALGLASIYIFIPANIRIANLVIISCTKNGADRFLLNNDNWKKWWPGTIQNNKDNYEKNEQHPVFLYHDDTFRLGKKNLGWADVLVKQGDNENESRLIITALSHDSVSIEWHCNLPKTWNPVSKILQYNRAVRLKENMQEVLSSLKLFMQKEENIYGLQIQKTTLEDTILVARKQTSSIPPSTNDVYAMFASLKDYVKTHNARLTGRPMLNVTKISDNEFQTMVALPIDKSLPSKGDIMQKKMVPGNFLAAEVTGGVYTVIQAMEQIQFYMNDHNMVAPAIPFQSLITDRTSESDTSKWVTKLYAPFY